MMGSGNNMAVKNSVVSGTNLVVRMTLALANDGWNFVVEDDIVIKAFNEETNERVFFSSAGDLKNWLYLKAEDY